MMFIDVLFTWSVVIPPLIRCLTPLDCPTGVFANLALVWKIQYSFCFDLSHTKDNNVSVVEWGECSDALMISEIKISVSIFFSRCFRFIDNE